MPEFTPRFFLERLGPRRGLLVAIVLIVLIALADFATGYALRLSVLYLLPIGMAAWSAGAGAGIASAVLASLLWLLSFRSEHFYLNQAFYLWEAAGMLGSFIAFAWVSARLQRALRQADERFFRVLEEMQAAVCVVDEGNDAFVYANQAMMQFAGTASSITPAAFEQRLQGETSLNEVPVRSVKRGFLSSTVMDKETGRHYLMQSGPIPWGSNPHVKLKVLTDITEQRNAERLRAKHLAVMHQTAQITTLAETASVLAHEINQPLMVIATYTDAGRRLLEAPELDRKEIAGIMDKCHAQAVRAASILERMREFIRQRQHQPVPCELQSLIAEALDMVRPQLEDAQVIVEGTQTLPRRIIEADKTLLLQVIVNLVRNAIDAMSGLDLTRRRVRFSITAPQAEEIVLSIADQGEGIDPASVEQIFSPFFTTKASGLGLGLAICRSIVEAHGGKLWASNNPEGGATFFLSLPARSE